MEDSSQASIIANLEEENQSQESFSSDDSTRTVIDIPFTTANIQELQLPNQSHSSPTMADTQADAQADQIKLKEIEETIKSSPPPKLSVILNHDNLEDWKINLYYILTYYNLNHIINYNFKTNVKEDSKFIRLDDITKSVMATHMNSSIRRKLNANLNAKEQLAEIECIVKGDTQVQSINLFSRINDVLVKKPIYLSYYVQVIKETMEKFDELYKEDTKEELWKCIFITGLNDAHDNLRSTLLSNEKANITHYFSQALKRHNVYRSNKDTSKRDKASINAVKESNWSCFECQGNHKLKYCPQFKEKKKSNPDYKPQKLVEYQRRKEINSITTSENAEAASRTFVAPLVCNINLQKSSKTYLDSGATANVANSKDLLINFKPSSNESVSTASGEEYIIQGVGDRIINFGTHSLKLTNVILCESIQANFISVRALASKGFKTTFVDNQALVKFNNEIVFRAYLEKETDLYKVTHNDNRVNAINNSMNDAIVNWHVKLGHISIQKLRVIADKLNIKIPSDFVLKCKICNLTKLSKLPFNSSLSKNATKAGQEFHMDLSGKIRIFNKQHFAYFLLLTDIFSRYTYTFLLKRKSEVPEVFEFFVKMIRNKFNSPIEKFHSDNGSEFINQSVKDVCVSEGIVQSFTTINCPQENSIVERNNRSIEQLARSLIKQANLRYEFWPYAVMHAVVLKNRLPHSSLNNQIPFNLFHNTEFDEYHKLNTFGSKCYYILEKSERKSKFDETSREAIYLGKSTDSSGSYVFDLTSKCILVRRHIKLTNDFLVSGECDTTDDISQPFSDLVDENYELNVDLNEDDRDFYSYKRMQLRNKENVQEINPSVQCQQESDQTNQDYTAIENSRTPLSTENNDSNIDTHTETSSLNQHSLPQKGTTYEFSKQQLQNFKENYKQNIGKDFDIRFFAPVHKVINGQTAKGIAKYKICVINVPRFYHQVNKSKEKTEWYDAMKEEIASMEQKQVFELVKRPQNVQVIPTMWVYRVKFKLDGSVDKFKARLVALGNKQSADGEFNYSPVINQLSLRTVLAFACKNKMYIHQLDVCSAYLNSDLNEQVYVEQPFGFQDDKRNFVWLLRKAIYGLRSSARKWYETITEILVNLKFKRTLADECVFVRKKSNNLSIIAIYVDDIVICSSSFDDLNQIKIDLDNKIQITDKGEINQFLNLNIIYSKEEGKLSIDSSSYIEQTLIELEMNDSHPKNTPMVVGADIYSKESELLEDKSYFMSGLGRIIYLSSIRPDIQQAVGKLCRFMSNPRIIHLNMLKHLLRYLKATKDYKLKYVPICNIDEPPVIIYTDADYKPEKSTSGACTLLFGCLVNSFSRSQSYVSTSTTQAETNAIYEGVCDYIYVCDLLQQFEENRTFNCVIYNDNQSSINSIRKGGEMNANRHYKSKINMIREKLESRRLSIAFIGTKSNLADVFTKPVSGNLIKQVMKELNLVI